MSFNDMFSRNNNNSVIFGQFVQFMANKAEKQENEAAEKKESSYVVYNKILNSKLLQKSDGELIQEIKKLKENIQKHVTNLQERKMKINEYEKFELDRLYAFKKILLLNLDAYFMNVKIGYKQYFKGLLEQYNQSAISSELTNILN